MRDWWEFKDSLGYLMSSRSIHSTIWDSVSIHIRSGALGLPRRFKESSRISTDDTMTVKKNNVGKGIKSGSFLSLHIIEKKGGCHHPEVPWFYFPVGSEMLRTGETYPYVCEGVSREDWCREHWLEGKQALNNNNIFQQADSLTERREIKEWYHVSLQDAILSWATHFVVAGIRLWPWGLTIWAQCQQLPRECFQVFSVGWGCWST